MIQVNILAELPFQTHVQQFRTQLAPGMWFITELLVG